MGTKDIDPSQDGIDHINVYSKGETPLGKALSNFSTYPLSHPLYGNFQSMEAYWYWLKTGKQHDHLRSLHGFLAKKKGKELEVVTNENFEEEVFQGLLCKLTQRPKLLKALIENELPLVHYYCYHGKVVEAKGYDLCGALNKICDMFKGET